MNQNNVASDEEGMAQALLSAANGMFNTTPNPRVGCVIVQQGQVIARGFTQPAGQAHAEIDALRAAANHGLSVRGATVFVTLEPCSHYGRTPPCVDALIDAGVGRVAAAIVDPNPLVSGQGLAKLAAAGIETRCGVLADAAREMNIGFFSRMQRGRPWVRLKTAASLDGKTALPDGRSQWITSAEARADGHQWRARACAILAGIGTITEDNSQLTVRDFSIPHQAPPRQPLRIVVDSRLQINLSAKVLIGGGTLIVTATPDLSKQAALVAAGCEVLLLPNAQGKVDLPALMMELGRRGINELHVESGAKLNGSLIREDCVDELLVYMAPMLLGAGRAMFDVPPPDQLNSASKLAIHNVAQVGPDIRILARFIA
jgi:diaminohydroxyphosphoribosylaminopyrimidine deaminase/5-amino-6-(5-phosphoribosylamino)uracil reductase